MKHPSYFSSLLKNLSHLNPSSLHLNSSIIPHLTSHFTPPSTLLLVLASASCDSLSWSWFSTYFCPVLGAEELVTSQANISIGEVKSLSRVRLCATPQMAAHQAPPSLGFSRQEHWRGLPFPSPMHESEKWKWSRSVVSDSWQPHGLQPTRLLHPWDFPGRDKHQRNRKNKH